jgi:hypothetical protein
MAKPQVSMQPTPAITIRFISHDILVWVDVSLRQQKKQLDVFLLEYQIE